MSVFVATDVRTYLDGFDVSGDLNEAGLEYKAAMLDATAFTMTTRRRAGGLKEIAYSMRGFWQGGDTAIDKTLFDRLAVADAVLSVAPEGAAEGALAYTFKSILGQYQPGASVGELLAFTVSGEGRDVLVRGTVMHNATRGSSATGTARQLGAVAAGQRLYGALHVLSASGSTPTLDVVVASDDSSGFASPTTRLTFSQATARGAQWASVAGAITDGWWRVGWTIGGSGGPSFTFVVILGIL